MSDTPSGALVRYGQPAGRWMLLATVLGSSLAFIDATVVNIALPRIGADFTPDAAGLQWTVNGYTLSLAALILLGGSLGDRYGRKRIFLLGRGLVRRRLAAVRAGAEHRGADRRPGAAGHRRRAAHPGLAGDPGGVVPAARTGPRRSAPGPAWAASAGAIGPFLGGWLVEVASWRLVFLINVAARGGGHRLRAARHVPESRNPAAARRLDVAGVVTGAVGLAGLTYGFTAWPDARLRLPDGAGLAGGRRRRAGRLRARRTAFAPPDAAAGDLPIARRSPAPTW